MFTGIIKGLGTVKEIENYDGGIRMVIASPFSFVPNDIGASIACNGACMTVVKYDGGDFKIDISNESLDKTTISAWVIGDKINLERATKVGDELGGHIVTGHVDATATLAEVEELSDNKKLTFEVDNYHKKFVAKKGSVTLNGVSLTVNEVDDNRFSVNLVPHTLQETNLGNLAVSDRINFEIDILARYVERLQTA